MYTDVYLKVKKVEIYALDEENVWFLPEKVYLRGAGRDTDANLFGQFCNGYAYNNERRRMVYKRWKGEGFCLKFENEKNEKV